MKVTFADSKLRKSCFEIEESTSLDVIKAMLVDMKLVPSGFSPKLSYQNKLLTDADSLSSIGYVAHKSIFFLCVRQPDAGALPVSVDLPLPSDFNTKPLIFNTKPPGSAECPPKENVFPASAIAAAPRLENSHGGHASATERAGDPSSGKLHDDAVPQQSWTCKICTFDNSDMQIPACNVCNARNPNSQLWTCSACTFQNSDMDLDACDVCGSPRHIIAPPPPADDAPVETTFMKNCVSIADGLPPEHPLSQLVEGAMADFQANYHHRQQDIIASLLAANSGSADGSNADSACASTPLQEGSRVRIENLKDRAAMNGRTGVICSAFNQKSGRWTVQVDADGANLPHQLSIRPANLKAIQTSSADANPKGIPAHNFATQWLDEDGRVWPKQVDFLRQCPKGHVLAEYEKNAFDSSDTKQLLCRICHTTCPTNSACAAGWNVCSVVSGCCFGYAVCGSCASNSSVAAAPSTGADEDVRTQVGAAISISGNTACSHRA
jgi:hypothetical protein